MNIARVPHFGFSYDAADYYGFRHSAHIGWWLIFWGSEQ